MKINLNLLLQKKGGTYMSKEIGVDEIVPIATSYHPYSLTRALLIKILMKIQIVSLFLCFGLMHAHAWTYGQQITLKKQKANITVVLKDIEKQSGYTFFYKKADLDTKQEISVEIKNATLKDALNIVLKDVGVTYNVFDKTIVLKKDLTLKTSSLSIPIAIESSIQQRGIAGTVQDANGGFLVGVSISIKRANGTTLTTSTREDGHFTIPNLNTEEVLELSFSYVGYQTQTLKIKANHTERMLIRLKPEETAVEQVVVTGIFKKPVESFTGAATVVTAEELQRFGTRNLITSLRNIDPSFNIVESNSFGSDPNRLPEIQIRGNSNIPNVTELQDQTRTDLNTPLIILDGFESTLRKLYDLNENEVESITLLKDASATAMYGSRGANGVVIIKTKTPLPGKLRLSYRFDTNVEIADLTSYNLMNAKDKLELERIAGYYNNARAESDLPLKRYYNHLLNEINSGVETDWLAQPTRNGFGQRHNLRLEGGHDAFRYSASAQYNDIQGTMKGSGRGTFNGNITLSYVYNNIRFQNNLQIAEQKSAESPYGEFSDYAKLNPYWRIYDDNGDVLKVLGYSGNSDYYNRWTTLPTNPLYNATLNTFDTSKLSELTNNTAIEWNVLSGLVARARFGITKVNTQTDAFRPGDHTAFANYSADDVFRKGDYKYGVTNGFKYDGSATIEYNKRIGKHNIYSGLDYNIRQNQSTTYGFVVEGFNNANFDFLPMALQYELNGKPSGSESLVRSVGFTGNVSYNYANRYFSDFSLRVDGSSQFGSEKSFAPFWAFGLGWNIHEESFLKGNSYVNRLKLRGSIGTTGSQNFSAYQALSTYKYYLNDRYFNWTGAYLMGLGNTSLSWQTNFKNNIGLDAEFFGRSLRVTADYYVETTKDLISAVNLPASNGFSSYVENIGSLRNKGFEVKSTIFIVNNDKNAWSFTGAVIQNKNKILETSQALKDAQVSIRNTINNPGVKIYEEGYSSNAIWVVPSLGIDPSTGKELYLGADGLPTYVWKGANVTAVGTTDPDYFGNFSTFVRHKNLSVNLVFGYRFGGQQYNKTLIDKVETSNYYYNVDQRVYDSRWQSAGDNAAFKGLLVTTPTYKTSRFVQDENTLQLQNVNVQYALRNPGLLSRFKLQSLNLAANFADVFYISTIRRERGTEYPFARQVSFNINATF